MCLCGYFGVSRQAYYQHFWALIESSLEEQIVLKLVGALRESQPLLGGRKLYHLLKDQLIAHQIKMGRDAFFELLARYGLLIKRRKNRPRTTFSDHGYATYENLAEDLELNAVGQVWVADITYVRTQQGFLYLSLIMDAYSKKIVGYQLAENLAAVHSLEALQMALQKEAKSQPRIHHSDRGGQYCAEAYVQTLKTAGIAISMTERGDPRENAMAERLNGTLKNELLAHLKLGDRTEAKLQVQKAIEIYNHKRPHLSCSYFTPVQVHEQQLEVSQVWKKKMKNSDNCTNFSNPIPTFVKPEQEEDIFVKPVQDSIPNPPPEAEIL